MAREKSDIITNLEAAPRVLNPVKLVGGDVKVIIAEHVTTIIGIGDTYELCELPAGSRVLAQTNLFVEGNAAATAKLSLGITADHGQSLDVDKYITAVAVAADPDEFQLVDTPGVYLDNGSKNNATTNIERIAVKNSVAAFTVGTKIRLELYYV